MRLTYFIVAILLILETCFRLSTDQVTQRYWFILNPTKTLSTTFYLYYLFEHIKIIGFLTILYIENTRYKFLLYLFGADLAVYIFNYNSTLIYIGGFPIGMDVIKLVTFGIVIIREVLTHSQHERDTDSDERRNFIAYAHGHLSKTLWPFASSKNSRKTKIKDQ